MTTFARRDLRRALRARLRATTSMSGALGAIAVVLAIVCVARALAASAPSQQPVFRADVDIITVDATVTDERGTPVGDLGAAEFTVTVDGQPRRVVTAQFVPGGPAGEGTEANVGNPSVDRGFSSNASAAGARLVLIAVDQGSLTPGQGRAAIAAARTLLDRLGPADRVALIAFPQGPSVDFTTDREAIRTALDRVVGRADRLVSSYSVGLSEALDIDANDQRALNRVATRECQGLDPTAALLCATEIESEARDRAAQIQQQTSVTMGVFRRMLEEFGKLEGQKHVVWISQGLVIRDRTNEIAALRDQAAAARTTFYVLHLDQEASRDVAISRPSPSAGMDRQMLVEGLDHIAAVTGGTVFPVVARGEGVYERIARELSGSYLLGIEAVPSDRDGRHHDIEVRVARRGLRVRARRGFVVRPETAAGEPAKEAIADLLAAPMLRAGLPLRVATYRLPDREPGKTRILVSSEIDHGATAPGAVAVGLALFTKDGKPAGSYFDEATVEPLLPDRPTPLQHQMVVTVPDGSYVLRLAAVDATGRRGSVEHRFDAALASQGDVRTSDVFLYYPESGRKFRPPAAVVAGAEQLRAFVEIGGLDRSRAARAEARIEVRGEADPAVLLAATARVEPGDTATAATATLPIALLPPGDYLASAAVRWDKEVVTTAPRYFRVDVRSRSVSPGGIAGLFADDLAAAAPRFDTSDVLRPEVAAPLVERAIGQEQSPSPALVEALQALRAGDLARAGELARSAGRDSLAATFIDGLALLAGGQLEPAAGRFRAAIRLSSEFLPAVFYLGTCYAAGGRDREAVGAWQTALITESDSPVIFRLIAEAYLRLRDLDQALAIVREARETLPDAGGFGRLEAMALVHAGRFDEGLAALDTALGEAADPALARLAIRVTLASLAADVHTRDAAALRARLDRAARWAEAYDQTAVALIAAWTRYLSNTDVAATAGIPDR